MSESPWRQESDSATLRSKSFPRLSKFLSDVFPNADHVFALALDQADDLAIWKYARENECIVVTKDADFSELVFLRGFPPKVVWIRRGSCSTREIEQLLREHHRAIYNFAANKELGTLLLF